MGPLFWRWTLTQLKHQSPPTPTASSSEVPVNNISASAAPAPEACALKKNLHPLDKTDLCHTFDGTFKHSRNAKHPSFDDIRKLKAFLNAVDAGNDPFEQETPLCCNGFTIRGNLIWEVLEPQQDELLQRLKDYCNRTKRNLHLCDRGDTYKGKKTTSSSLSCPSRTSKHRKACLHETPNFL